MATNLRDLTPADLVEGNWLHRLVQFGWGRDLSVLDMMTLVAAEPNAVKIGNAARNVFVRLEFSPFPTGMFPLPLTGLCTQAHPVLGLDLKGNVGPAMCLAMKKMQAKKPASWARPVWAGPIPGGMAQSWQSDIAPGAIIEPYTDMLSFIYYPTMAGGYADMRAKLLLLGVTPDG